MHWQVCAKSRGQAGPLHARRNLRRHRGSPAPVATRLQHVTVELSEDTGRMLYIPEGFAHGFQTLTDDTEVFYQMTEFLRP